MLSTGKYRITSESNNLISEIRKSILITIKLMKLFKNFMKIFLLR